jgi:hypothetical protein
MQTLFHSLQQRQRPEDIALIILEKQQTQLSDAEKNILQKASKGALTQQSWGYSSMSPEFAKPVGFKRQLGVSQELFESISVPIESQQDNPEIIREYILQAAGEIKLSPDNLNFKSGRLNQSQRKNLGLELSRRRYNKLFRLLLRMEQKRNRLIRELKKREFTLIGKSRLASTLSWHEFSSDLNTASFTAYLTARLNLRSEFTVQGQERPYDEIAEMLFLRCESSASTNWFAIAHVFPESKVLANLSDEQKGVILGKWFTVLEEVASLLSEVWKKSEINRQTMIVRRGNDSSTWNNTASAWNRARDGWIAILYAMNMEGVLDEICLGKVLRLMAADVVAWHRAVGNKLDPDTAVWNSLPLPWEVLSGQASCPKNFVENICQKYGVDPVKSGWTAPRPPQKAVSFHPTPELVHGITIGHPGLATLLRKAGFFSGK